MLIILYKTSAQASYIPAPLVLVFKECVRLYQDLHISALVIQAFFSVNILSALGSALDSPCLYCECKILRMK